MDKNASDNTKVQTKLRKAKGVRSEFNSQFYQGFSGFLKETRGLQNTAGPGPSWDELLQVAVPNKKLLLAAPQSISSSLPVHSVYEYTVQNS